MIRQADKNDISRILAHLKKDIENCLYMYIDIKSYGTDNVTVWFDEDQDGIIYVAMKYHDSFQLYTDRNEFDTGELVAMLRKDSPSMINACEKMMKLIQDDFTDDYNPIWGTILELSRFAGLETNAVKVEVATMDDIGEIAELICNDEYYSDAYTYDEIYGQLRERMETDMGISYVVREDGKIIAHNSITAQCDDICIAGMLIVHRNARNNNISIELERFIIEETKRRGKRLFGFSTDKRRMRVFKLMGNSTAAIYGKLIHRS